MFFVANFLIWSFTAIFTSTIWVDQTSVELWWSETWCPHLSLVHFMFSLFIIEHFSLLLLLIPQIWWQVWFWHSYLLHWVAHKPFSTFLTIFLHSFTVSTKFSSPSSISYAWFKRTLILCSKHSLSYLNSSIVVTFYFIWAKIDSLSSIASLVLPNYSYEI